MSVEVKVLNVNGRGDPKTLERLRGLPGRHALTDTLMWLDGSYAVFEVDEHRNIWNINTKGERESMLADEEFPKDLFVLELATLIDGDPNKAANEYDLERANAMRRQGRE